MTALGASLIAALALTGAVTDAQRDAWCQQIASAANASLVFGVSARPDLPTLASVVALSRCFATLGPPLRAGDVPTGAVAAAPLRATIVGQVDGKDGRSSVMLSARLVDITWREVLVELEERVPAPATQSAVDAAAARFTAAALEQFAAQMTGTPARLAAERARCAQLSKTRVQLIVDDEQGPAMSAAFEHRLLRHCATLVLARAGDAPADATFVLRARVTSATAQRDLSVDLVTLTTSAELRAAKDGRVVFTRAAAESFVAGRTDATLFERRFAVDVPGRSETEALADDVALALVRELPNPAKPAPANMTDAGAACARLERAHATAEIVTAAVDASLANAARDAFAAACVRPADAAPHRLVITASARENVQSRALGEETRMKSFSISMRARLTAPDGALLASCASVSTSLGISLPHAIKAIVRRIPRDRGLDGLASCTAVAWADRLSPVDP